MIKEDAQLKLQAYFDGELPETEAREVANWLAQDAQAAGLLVELRNTRKALKGFAWDTKLPETREFYWSKIERDIRRLEQTAPARDEATAGFAWWRRYLVPAGAFAALVLMLASARQLNLFSRSGTHPFSPIETAFADTGVCTYRDHAAGITVVWLSYPGENQFAGTTPAATLQ
jgi:anti-sigma factor RsiW